jgi:hypothetical protein
VWFTPGGGADVLTGGNDDNHYNFAFKDYRADSVTGLLAGADTITNWNAVKANNWLGFSDVDLEIVPHVDTPQAGKASVSTKGLASFADTDNTLLLKLQAVVAATDGDPVGSAVIFNDGTDAYLYVVGHAGAGVQTGDALIRFNNVAATRLGLRNGDVTELNSNYPGPEIETATVAGDTLVLRYRSDLSTENLPTVSQFEIKVDGVTLAANGSAYNVSGVVENFGARSLVLKLAVPVKLGQSVSIAYTDLTTNDDLYGIQDRYGNDAASMAMQVSNLTSSYVVAGDTATVTAGGVLDVSNAMNLASVHTLALNAEGNQITMTAAQHAGFSTVTGSGMKDCFIIKDAVTGTGHTAIESYVLRDVSSFKLGVAGQNVAMANGANSLDIGAYHVTGILAALGNESTLYVRDGADLSAATVSGFNKLVFDPAGSSGEVQVKMTAAQHNQFTGGVTANGTGINAESITLTPYFDGTGFEQVENYILGSGRNFFTLGSATQNVTGGQGEDSVSAGTYTITGTLDGGEGIDWLSASGDISKATIKGFEHGTFSGTVRMTIAQNDGFGLTWMDSDTQIVFADAGVVQLKIWDRGGHFHLADGKNEVSLLNRDIVVTGGASDDNFVGNGGAVSGKYDGAAGTNTLSLSSTTDISAAQFSNIARLTLSPDAQVTMTAEQNNQLASVWETNGFQRVELTGSKGVGHVGIEEYVLKAGVGIGGTISFKAADGGQMVTGSSWDDTIVGGDGNDILVAGDGKNTLDGGAGDDTLIAFRRLEDQLTGGDGSDVFKLKGNTYPAKGAIITDFHRGNVVGVADKFGDIKASEIVAAVDETSTAHIGYKENAVLQVIDHGGDLDAAGIAKLFGGNRPFAPSSAPDVYMGNVTVISADETGNAQVWAVKVRTYGTFEQDVELVATLTGVNNLSATSFDMFNFAAT